MPISIDGGLRMKAYIWLISIEVRNGESWIKGSGAAATSLATARSWLEASFPECLTDTPSYIMSAPSLVEGQLLEFTCRFLEPLPTKALVMPHDA